MQACLLAFESIQDYERTRGSGEQEMRAPRGSLHCSPEEMDEVNDFSRVQRDTTSLSNFGSDPDAYKYGIMVPESSRHAGEPDTAYNDVCQGPLNNTTAEGSALTCSPDLHAADNLENILQDESSTPPNIPLQDLKEFTDNFSDQRILGRGGFGVVYKGVMRNREMIAVKRIMPSLMPGPQKQFESEVYHLRELKHPNIVRCVGYCYETCHECLWYNGKYIFAEMVERLLCLEYMPKGSLDKYLSDESSGLDWSTRYNIIKGICYGLCHLHEEIDMPIIHLDLKPPNILLDKDMVPKITDFGLSRLLDQEQTICTSSRDGTLGYMAPEHFRGGIITPKSDIFSLGVIIMEIVTGHRDYPDVTRTNSDDFIELVLEKWINVLQRSPGYESLETDCEQVKRCIQVGLLCVNPDRTKRPPIVKIINMLQGLESVDGVTFAIPTTHSVDTLHPSTFYRKVTELVGTYEKSLEVIKMMMEGDKVFKKQLKVVSIVGSGGLGKTTLANAVYEKLRVQFDIEKMNFQFECTAFVCVHVDPNMVMILKSLLHQLDKQKYDNINEATWGEVQLTSEIRKFLANKRYLIVIDDIWDKSAWENIKYVLTENEYGSRVITTTRILDVAQQAGSVYQLKPLSVADSRKLFYQRIYANVNKSLTNQLVEVAKNILERCGGVPLAIIVIGSLLCSLKGGVRTHEYWSMVLENMGSGLDNCHDDVKKMIRILSLSYYHLPYSLRSCLLHLSLYPKGYEIKTERLIWIWVGEGFVTNELGRSLYEVGEDYFNELISKGLVQPVQFDNVNKVHSCRVPDMVHHLITLLSKEDNFITAVGGPQTLQLPSRIHRLSVQGNIEEVSNQLLTMSLSKVRSLAVFCPAVSLLPILLGFVLLRVLDLTDCEQVDNSYWKDICNLFHLRYLSVKGTSITNIPEEIGNLQFLQVLDIRSTKIEEEPPSTFIRLRQLLSIQILGSISCAVPKWVCSMSFLFSLSITLKTLGEEDLQVLGSLPSLTYLHLLVDKPTQGRKKRLVADSGSSFMCLKSFIVVSDTMELKFASGAMQSLQTLQLHFYDVQDTLVQFGDFVLGLENLSSLEHIEVTFRKGHTEKINSVTNAMEKEIDMNRNMPKLKVVALEALEEKMRASIEEYRAASVALDERF